MPETIKIRLLTSVSSTDYSYAAGEEVDAPKERALDLLKAGYAVPFGEVLAETRETAIPNPATRETRKK